MFELKENYNTLYSLTRTETEAALKPRMGVMEKRLDWFWWRLVR